MSDGYTKLFGSIIHSTIWQEKDHTRIVWITMLAMTNRYGEVSASIPGLAVAAKVSIPLCEEALNTLSSPDKYSRSKDFDGRRIAEIKGGWVLLNYMQYRELISEDNRRERNAERQSRHRQKSVTLSNATVTPSNPIAEAEAESRSKEGDIPQTPKPSKLTKSGRQAGATPLPDGLVATPEHLARCKRESLDCSRELDKFKANALAKGLLYKNWNAAFTTWLLRSVEFRGSSGSALPNPSENGLGKAEEWDIDTFLGSKK